MVFWLLCLGRVIQVDTQAPQIALAGGSSYGSRKHLCAQYADIVCVAVQGVITERPWLVVLPLGATVMDEDHPVCCVWVKHPYSARIKIHNHAVGWKR